MELNKQVIELVKVDPVLFAPIMDNYYDKKAKDKTFRNFLKAIEQQINVIKKIYSETPK